jgi:hypothetical protein
VVLTVILNLINLMHEFRKEGTRTYLAHLISLSHPDVLSNKLIVPDHIYSRVMW